MNDFQRPQISEEAYAKSIVLYRVNIAYFYVICGMWM